MAVHYTIVVAMSENRVIGRKGTLPWRMPADLAHFKRITMGHPILMGRKNHEDIGRCLPGRSNIILTHQEGFQAQSCIVVHNLREVESVVPDNTEIMVIGGAEIYAQLMSRASCIHLTLIHANIDGDTFFPEFDHAAWKETECQNHPADEKNPYPYSFVTMEKKRNR